MKLAYFDCFSGASGDMILGALIDAGADPGAINRALNKLGVEGCLVEAGQGRKRGIAATEVRVPGEYAKAPHRSLEDIRRIIGSGDLVERVRDRALQIFSRLADAEASVHGCAVEKVHFHEVGAVDAIADIVGASVALDLLEIDNILCSPLPTGSGTVKCAHGVLPVPAPATLHLLRGFPLAGAVAEGELTTPTGAAILTTLAQNAGPMPAMAVERVGYGAGRRDLPDRPNVLRVAIGRVADSSASTDEVVVLHTSVDDATGEQVAHCLDRLLAAGALDSYCQPINMKKSRPGLLLTVLAPHDRADDLEAVIFAELPTLGVRRQTARRTVLPREYRTVDTAFGPIGIKVARRQGEVITAAVEYEDARRAASEKNVPLRRVMDAAIAAWHAGQDKARA